MLNDQKMNLPSAAKVTTKIDNGVFRKVYEVLETLVRKFYVFFASVAVAGFIGILTSERIIFSDKLAIFAVLMVTILVHGVERAN